MNVKKLLLCAAGFVALSTAAANAASYTVAVKEYVTGGSINAQAFTPCTGSGTTACATFTYTGALNFYNNAAQNTTDTGDLNSSFGFSNTNVSNYVGSGSNSADNYNFTNLTNFLASSGSISGEAYGSLYSVDLGTLAAGTILTVTHDDGIYLTDNGTAFGTVTTGPTVAVTESATVGTAGDIKLYYTRQNGTPSILQVSVPEPASLSIFGAALLGLVGMAGLKRRNRKSV